MNDKDKKKLAEFYKNQTGKYPIWHVSPEDSLKKTTEYQKQRIKQAEQAARLRELEGKPLSGLDSLALGKKPSKPKPVIPPKKPTEKEKLATQVSIRKSKEYLADKKKVTKPKTPPANFVKRYFANELNDAEVTYFKKTYIEPEKVYAEKKYLAGGAPSSLAKAKAITYIKQKWGLKYGKYFSPERALFGESPIKEKKEWDKLDLGL